MTDSDTELVIGYATKETASGLIDIGLGTASVMTSLVFTYLYLYQKSNFILFTSVYMATYLMFVLYVSNRISYANEGGVHILHAHKILRWWTLFTISNTLLTSIFVSGKYILDNKRRRGQNNHQHNRREGD